MYKFSKVIFYCFLFHIKKKKMNFKDLQYSIGKLKSDVQTHLAKNNPMQKQDTKSLSLWIFEERNDLASMRTLGYQRSETNKALKTWVSEDMTGENTKDLEVNIILPGFI